MKEREYVMMPYELFKRLRFLIDGIAIMGTRELDMRLRSEFVELAKGLDVIDPRDELEGVDRSKD
jgi:hypothetical protein